MATPDKSNEDNPLASDSGLLPAHVLEPTAEDLDRVAHAKRVVILHAGELGEVWSVSSDWLRRGLGLDPVAMVNNVVRGGLMSLLWCDGNEAVLLADDCFPSASGAFAEFAPSQFFDRSEGRERMIHRVFGSA